MCRFKSGIIFKTRIVLAPEGNESHSDLLERLGIEDTNENAMRKFVRAELIPFENNKASDISKWRFNVDQDITPDWFTEDPGRYEENFREKVADYLKSRFEVICGYPWNKINDDEFTYYFMDGLLGKSEFGDTNDYRNSELRKMLVESDLAKKLENKFGDKLVPISLDLLSLDGLDDYGKCEGDILAVPTIDIYRKFRKNISKLDSSYWLATPDSTPSGYGSDSVRYVDSGGDVDCGWCGDAGAVRPFFVLKSSIFVS